MLGHYDGLRAPVGQGLPHRNPNLEKLLALWRVQKGWRLLPARGEFSPLLLKPWQGHVGMIDVFYEPMRFRVRSTGQALIGYGGGDYTGQWFDECVEPEDYDSVIQPYMDCIKRREPVFSNTIYTHPGASRSLMQRLYLPCSSNRSVIDTIMVAIYALPGFEKPIR